MKNLFTLFAQQKKPAANLTHRQNDQKKTEAQDYASKVYKAYGPRVARSILKASRSKASSSEDARLSFL